MHFTDKTIIEENSRNHATFLNMAIIQPLLHPSEKVGRQIVLGENFVRGSIPYCLPSTL